VPAWRREAAAVIAGELGPLDAPWVEWGERLPTERSPIVLSLVGHRAPASERSAGLHALAAGLTPAGVAVVVDHNRPRRILAALGALVRWPWVPGSSPLARWRRLAYPTAREVQAAGLRVERLRLVAGERVQIVIATRAHE
jgi:hypothetical protein